MNEIWKDIAGYEGLYEVSSKGRVRSLPRQTGKFGIKGRILKQFNNRGGYCCVCLSKEGCSATIGVHRLVAIAFVPNPENKPQVNHKDEDKQNNNADNLEWVTLQENLEHGTRAKRQRKSITESLGIPVIQILKDEHTAIKEYESISQAAEAVNASPSEIRNCIEGKVKTVKGFCWRKREDISDKDLIFWQYSGERVSAPKSTE